jgi:hypothetical protein
MWMDECDIVCAQTRIQGPPSLVRAAQCLVEFCELINSISDGWAYWGYGTKCSADLQAIVSEAQWPINQLPGVTDWRKIKPAIKKIVTFLSRCEQTKENEYVIEFVNKWKEKKI